MLHSLQRLRNVYHRRLCQKQLYRFLCGFALLQELLGQIHIAVVRYHLILPDHGRQLLFDLAHGDAHLREGYPLIEQLHSRFEQSLCLQIEMPVLCPCVLQRIEQRTVNTLRITQVSTGFLHDGVNTLESESRHLTEIERTLSHNVCAGRPEMLIDLLRGRWRDLERGQQGHQDTHPAGFRIGVLDLCKPLLCNTADFKKPVWLMFQNLQSVDTKLFNDRVGGLFSDAFQQTGGKIIADALQCGRHDLLPMIDLKLEPVFSVLPLSIHLDLHRIRLRQFDADGGKADQVVVIAIGTPGFCRYAAVLRLHPKDRILAGRIEKQYLVQCCNNAHSTSPPFPFTLPAKQLFSHGIFAIQTP